MDIAVFSDIHSNHIALQSCFDYCVARGITRFVVLGDVLTDCPYPEKTLELLHTLRQYFTCMVVRGAREQLLLDYRKKGARGWKNGSAAGSYLYTYEGLSVRDLSFFDTCPVCAVWKEEGVTPFTFCHGSPTSVHEPLFRDRRNARKAIAQMETELLIHGSTHVPDAFEYHGKKAICPGSVGIPHAADGRAQFLVLHGEDGVWGYEHVALPYDREALYKEFEESGLMERAPAWCALTMHTLRTGTDLTDTVSLRAMQLCREERGEARWPDIPEIYWAFALREMRIDLYGRRIPDPVKKEKRA